MPPKPKEMPKKPPPQVARPPISDSSLIYTPDDVVEGTLNLNLSSSSF